MVAAVVLAVASIVAVMTLQHRASWVGKPAKE
jgi:hypothetical protein